MVEFCIHCFNILLIKELEEKMAFYCPMCPYVRKIRNKLVKVTEFAPKKVEEPSVDINEISSSKTMGKLAMPSLAHIIIFLKSNHPSFSAVCPKCSFSEAYFFQLQIRSADEPMTSFYTCVKCEFKWKEN